MIVGHSSHAPGPSLRLLHSFPLGFLIGLACRQKSVQNPYKSDRFCECEFFNVCVPITYSFNALKCTDFPVVTSLRLRPLTPGCSSSPLSRDEGRGEGQTGQLF